MEHIPRHIPIVVITPGVPEPEMVEAERRPEDRLKSYYGLVGLFMAS